SPLRWISLSNESPTTLWLADPSHDQVTVSPVVTSSASGSNSLSTTLTAVPCTGSGRSAELSPDPSSHAPRRARRVTRRMVGAIGRLRCMGASGAWGRAGMAHGDERYGRPPDLSSPPRRDRATAVGVPRGG